MRFQDYLEKFIQEYSLKDNVSSERTRAFHAENMIAFQKFLKEKMPRLLDDFSKVNEAVVKAYLKYMVDKGLAKATIEGRIKTLRVFSKVLSEAGYLNNFCQNISYRVKRNHKLTPFLDHQVEALFKQLDPRNRIHLRMRAFLKLALDTGARLHEIFYTNIGDVNLKDMEIFIRTAKGGKQRFIPFGRDTAKCLQQYFAAFNISPHQINDPMFQTLDRSRWAQRSIQNDMNKLGKMAEIKNVRVSPHTCRHTFAINQIRNRVPLPIVQYFLGHETLETVNIYVKICQELYRTMYISYNDSHPGRPWLPVEPPNNLGFTPTLVGR